MVVQTRPLSHSDRDWLPHPASLRGGLEAPVRPCELRRWARWLRTNPDRQVRGTFRKRAPDGSMLVCAIGALEEIAGTDVTFLFSPTNEGKFMQHVVLMNDSLGWSFGEIADWIDLVADGQLGLRAALAIRQPTDLSAPYGPPGRHSLSYEPLDLSTRV